MIAGLLTGVVNPLGVGTSYVYDGAGQRIVQIDDVGTALERRTASQEGGADGTLAPVKARPDTLEGAVAARAVDGVNGGGNGADDGPLEKRPQGAGGQAQPTDFVGDPDAEGPSTAATPMAVAAKDPPRPDDFSLGVAVVKQGLVAHVVPSPRGNAATVPGARRTGESGVRLRSEEGRGGVSHRE